MASCSALLLALCLCLAAESKAQAVPGDQLATVRNILNAEPGAIPQAGVLQQTGRSEAGGAPGRFELSAELKGSRSRLTTISGTVGDDDGWDGGAWASHDGAVTPVDLPGAVADARAENFLRRYGWRDPSLRARMRVLGGRVADGRGQECLEVIPVGADRVRLCFDAADHRLAEAIVDADMGPLSIRFSDWRKVGDADYAFRRERRDATGQSILLVTEEAALLPSAKLGRPEDARRGVLAANSSVPFTLTRGEGGHIVVDVFLNRRPAKLVFDTGAANYLTPAVATQYGLHAEGGLNVGGVGESSYSGGFARIASLEIGAARLIDTSTIVAPLPDGAIHPRPGLELQGLTGFELLHAFRTTIDYDARTLSFAPPAATPADRRFALPYASDGQALFVKADVGGHSGWFRLDTGDAGGVTIFSTFAARYGLHGSGQTKVAQEAGGAMRTMAISLDTFVLAGRSFRDVRAQISAQSAGAFASRSISGNLGAGILSCFELTIDPRWRQVAFDLLPKRILPKSCVAGSDVPIGQ